MGQDCNGWINAFRRSLAEANELLCSAAASAEQSNDRRLWRAATELIAAIEASQAKWDAARETVVGILKSADYNYDRRARVSALREIALFSLHLGDFEEAALRAELIREELHIGVEAEETAGWMDFQM